jgi:predicted  nucleic acid-binding Zn-ribbon protein
MTPTALKAASIPALNELKKSLIVRLDALDQEMSEMERRDKNIRAQIRRINRELETRRTLPK